MKTLLIIFLLITSVGYSQTDTLTFKAGAYEAGVYVRDANGIVWQTIKKANVTASPKAGATWKRITPLPVPVTTESLQAEIATLKAMIDNLSFTTHELRNSVVTQQTTIQDLQSKLDNTTLTFVTEGDGIPLITVEGNVVRVKTLKFSGKKLKPTDSPTNITIEQQ